MALMLLFVCLLLAAESRKARAEELRRRRASQQHKYLLPKEPQAGKHVGVSTKQTGSPQDRTGTALPSCWRRDLPPPKPAPLCRGPARARGCCWVLVFVGPSPS